MKRTIGVTYPRYNLSTNLVLICFAIYGRRRMDTCTAAIVLLTIKQSLKSPHVVGYKSPKRVVSKTSDLDGSAKTPKYDFPSA